GRRLHVGWAGLTGSVSTDRHARGDCPVEARTQRSPRHERGHRSHALVIVLHEHLRDPDTTSGGFVDGLLRVDGQQTHQHTAITQGPCRTGHLIGPTDAFPDRVHVRDRFGEIGVAVIGYRVRATGAGAGVWGAARR